MRTRLRLAAVLPLLISLLVAVALVPPSGAATLPGLPVVPSTPLVGAAPAPSGAGLWMVGGDGGVFTVGDAGFFGSTGSMRLNRPIVGMAASPSGRGYWLVASDGGIFTFGDAGFFGSTGSIRLNQPIVGMASAPGGRGYWFVARDGGVFAFGAAPFLGSGAGSGGVFAGMAATGAGGYWLVRDDGSVESLGDASSVGDPRRVSPMPAPDPAGRPVLPVPSWAKQDGITHPAWWHDEYDMADSDRMIGEIAGTGAGWIVIVPTWYQASRTSTTIAPDPKESPTESSVRHAIRVARSRGLRVLLKPHVDLAGFTSWRGELRPGDLDAWFGSYTQFIATWARVAQEEGVEELAVGTELASLSGYTSRWYGVIDEVRRVYGGWLTYAANYDEYQGVSFWDRLDAIGIDAYFELVDQPTTDPAVLRAAWAPIAVRLEQLADRWHKPILFTEAGYVSQVGTTTEPWNWELSAVRSDLEQAAAYRALFETFWDRPWFAGVHWWMWDDFEGGDEDQALDYTPHGKPAEAVLRDWFG